jgi:hypothetical protein
MPNAGHTAAPDWLGATDALDRAPIEKYVVTMLERTIPHLLPEEDALDDLDEDHEADPSLPGDLWFHSRRVSGPKCASYTADWSAPGTSRRGLM